MGSKILNIFIDNLLLVIFMGIFLFGWVGNALFHVGFMMEDLKTLAWAVTGQHGMNSLLNSPIPFVQQFKGGGMPQNQPPIPPTSLK